MNKKFILSSLLVATVLIGVIVGTMAFFTATQTVEDAGLVAGTLDLDVRSGQIERESFTLANLGEDYTMSGEKEWVVKNTGTLPGRLYVALDNLQNINHGCNEPKMIARESLSIEACEQEEGRLGEYMEITLQLDGVDLFTSTLRGEDESVIRTNWEQLAPIVFQADEEKTFRAYWSANPDEYGNEIQNDEVRFNIEFHLTQLLEDN